MERMYAHGSVVMNREDALTGDYHFYGRGARLNLVEFASSTVHIAHQTGGMMGHKTNSGSEMNAPFTFENVDRTPEAIRDAPMSLEIWLRFFDRNEATNGGGSRTTAPPLQGCRQSSP